MQGRLYGLDALRGIAALLVALHHLQSTYSNYFLPVAAVSAVDLFLVISGYVMARTYDRKLASDLAARAFIALRYRRLAPCMAVGAFFGFLIYNDGSWHAFAALVAALTFMPFPFFGGIFTINIPTWSLFVEIVCNAVHKFLTAKVLWAALIVSCAIFIPPTLANGQTYWGSDMASLGIATARGLACYILGILTFRRFTDRPLGNPYLAIAGMPVLLLIGAHLPGGIFAVAFVVVAPLIVLGALNFPHPAHLVGGLSFPLYAIHLPVIQLCNALGASIPWAMGSVALATALLYLAIERRRPKGRAVFAQA